MPAGPFVLELPPVPEAAAIARSFVVEHGDALPPDLVEDAVVCVSELVTNAVLHGRPTITLEMSNEPPGIGIAVSDHGDAIPTLTGSRPDTSSPHGRGLLIVAALAAAWGVEPAAVDGRPGKTIWFRLYAQD